MTNIDIEKSKFNMLVAKCFDKTTLEEVNIEEIFLQKKSKCYYVIFSIGRMLSTKEEFTINSRKEKVFFGMPNVKFFFDYSKIYQRNDNIIEYINNVLLFEFSAFKPFLQESHSYIDSGRYNIDFKNTMGKDMFITLGLGERIEEILGFNFKKSYALALGIDKNLKGNYVSDVTVFEPIVDKEEITAGEKKAEKQKRKPKPKPKTKLSSNGKVLLGNPIRKKIMDICEISDEVSKVAVVGDVIDIDHRTCKNASKLILFHITDYTSTILCKLFTGKEKFNRIYKEMKDSHIKLEGEISFDLRTKEFTIKPQNIMLLDKDKKQDTAEEKRVELHLHTVMSAEDATIKIEDIVDRAKQYGHKAFAITDHGVLQAYPTAQACAKKAGIDIIYGMEAYLTLDRADVYRGTKDIPLNGEFVVADIETTGFSPAHEAITEIGAVRIVDGEVVDSFSTFADPEKPLPMKIVQITGITAKMLEGAPSQEEALRGFKEFAGKACIVAHNASFDMSFFQSIGAKYGIYFNDNPVLDTLGLSRCLLSENKKHDLKTVTKHFSIDLVHHRALNDAKATAEVLLCFFNMMDDMGIESTGEMNSGLAHLVANKDAMVYHAILLCKNKTGLRNLYKMVSKSHLEGFYRRPRLAKSYLAEHREGLLIGSACEQGEVYQAILNNTPDRILDKTAEFYDYFEIQPDGNNEFMIREGRIKDIKALRNINKKIIALGEKHGKLTVATCDSHFMDERDKVFREIIMTVKKFEDAHLQPPLYFRTTDEMLEEFRYLGEEKAKQVVVKNTNKIYERIEKFELLPSEPAMPKIENADEMLSTLAYKTAHDMYGETLPNIVQKRLDREMGAICEHGYAVLYYIAHELIKNSLEDGYIVGSRGSVGSSFAATMTGVTEVNPLPPHYRCGNCKFSDFEVDKAKYHCGVDLPPKKCPECGEQLMQDGFDIPFETFLGLNADKVPDIDLNFSGDYQPKAHAYTIKYFGAKHVFRAGTISTISDKTAFGYVKNYLEVNDIQATSAEITRLANGITGVKRTTGQHPGGLVVLPKDKSIYDYTPVQKPANDMSSKSVTTHFDFESLHDTLVKLDILGHDDPTMLKMLSDLTGVDAKKVPLNDEKTMTLFSSLKALGLKKEQILDSEVGTFGVPEFGTKFVRGVLLLTRPTTMAELIRISGLSHGADVWQGNADVLIREGKANLSEVISTRDDIMNTLVDYGVDPKLAFFTMERVRKGKGLTEEMEKAMEDAALPPWFIDSCKKITYMFPKAHAVAYVTMALRIAYFKVHHPLEYYATYFTVRADNFDTTFVFEGVSGIRKAIKDIERKQSERKATANENTMVVYLELALEMHERGIGFLPVDLEKSTAKEYRIEGNNIRLPFVSLPGIGENAAENLFEQAKKKTFISKEDIKIRAKASKTVLDALEKFGCLAGVTSEDQMSFFDM